MTNQKLDREAIKARAEKATPGRLVYEMEKTPYMNRISYNPQPAAFIKVDGHGGGAAIATCWGNITRHDAESLAKFITHAHTDILDVLSALEAAEGTLVEIEEYWNGNENHGAMSDALDHILDLVHKALRGEGN